MSAVAECRPVVVGEGIQGAAAFDVIPLPGSRRTARDAVKEKRGPRGDRASL